MTQPRSRTVYDDRPGIYHCVTRCVRQAFLFSDATPCAVGGSDRRAWIEQRLLDLAESFAVGLYAWAGMSNHVHVVVLVDPLRPERWSDEEVADRWSRISQYPGRPVTPERRAQRAREVIEDESRLAEIRRRLGSLSWFMRFLNEGIARRANREDGCKGHFWDGRFRSQNLLDDRSALAAMAYVDLNPIRAGMAETLTGSRFTSIHRRLALLQQKAVSGADPLLPIAGITSHAGPMLSVNSYVDLLDWTGRQQHPRYCGRISASAPRAPALLASSAHWWTHVTNALESSFAGFVGLPTSLAAEARRLKQVRLRGLNRQLERLADPEDGHSG